MSMVKLKPLKSLAVKKSGGKRSYQVKSKISFDPSKYRKITDINKSAGMTGSGDTGHVILAELECKNTNSGTDLNILRLGPEVDLDGSTLHGYHSSPPTTLDSSCTHHPCITPTCQDLAGVHKST